MVPFFTPKHNQSNEKQTMELEKIFRSHTSYKGLICQIHMNLIQLNSAHTWTV